MPKNEPEKVDLKSKNIEEDQKRKLKEMFPNVFNEDKVDFERLRLSLGEDVDAGAERYGMVWPGKAECMKVIQQPSIGTLKPVKKESVDFDTTENLFIEGDNLEVLKLLQNSYYGKIKMIYIDPPYNTGNEFIYPDKYSESLETYLAYTGQADAEGRKFSTNTEADGRFHSKWLNMMYPRLYLSRNLLRDDGSIFISIDDNEVSNLRKMCDEIFGEENCVANVVWKRKRGRDNSAKWFSKSHEYLLIYSKNKDLFETNYLELEEETKEAYKNPDNDPRGIYRMLAVWARGTQGGVEYEFTNKKGQLFSKRLWLFSKDNLQKLDNDDKLIVKGDNIYRKLFITENKGKIPETIWDNVSNAANAADEIKKIFGSIIFDTPKPVPYVSEMLKIATSPQPADSSFAPDIVLDFFAGSATTANAILDQNKQDRGNRKFILVQLPEPCAEDSEALKAGYGTISDIGKERIRRAAKKIKSDQREEGKEGTLFQKENDDKRTMDLGFKVFKLDRSNFKIWESDIAGKKGSANIEKQLELHIDHIDAKATTDDILYELLLKSGFPLATKVEEKTVAKKKVYSVEGGTLLICLEKELTKEVITDMARLEPARVVCLDQGFAGNDQLKTNAVQIMKSHGVNDFRTV